MLTARPRLPAHLPLLRCTPSRDCPQRCRCMRAAGPLAPNSQAVDASVLAHTGGTWCPMFLDVRGAELLRVAV